jgi:hypothetical protein
MKVTSFLLLFVAFIALVNAQQTGSTGAATGPEPSKAEEAKVEKAKKEEMEHTVANQKASQITEIKKVVANAITDTNKYAGEQKAACTIEEAESKKWAKEADPEAAEKARLERRKGKQALLEAIEYRQKILKKFLDKLYAARFTLGDSIHRTNNIYFSAYDANVNTQIQAHNAIRFLGVASIGKYNRGSMGIFVPIKLPNIHDDEKEEAAAEKKDGVEGVTGGAATGATGGVDSDASPEVQHQKTLIANNHAEYKAAKQRQLMEVQSKVDSKTANCVGAECDADYKATFVLYKLAFDTDCANYKVYDVEQRTPLALYREGLKHLIKVREEKLKALEKQAAELRASLADPGQTLAELFPLIDQHIKIQDVACKKMPINTEKVLKELKSMQADIAAGKFSCEIEGGEKDISATGSADDKDAKAEAAKTAAVAKETEAAASSGPADKKEEDKTPSAASSGPAEKKTTTDESKSSSSGATGSTGITNSVEEVFDGQAQ